MKKRVLSKLLLALVTASLLLSGCGTEETDGNVESSQIEEEQETKEKIESDDVVDDNMENDESDNLSVEIDDEEPWNGVYSEKDAPGLTSIDWDLFNGYMYAEQTGFLGDVNLEINVLQVLGSDPRINNDWSVLNENFSTLYGNDKEGMAKFAQDVAFSYEHSIDFASGFCDYATLIIEPYRSNTDNGVYGEITEGEITNQQAYDDWKDESNQNTGSGADMTVYDQIRSDFNKYLSDTNQNITYDDINEQDRLTYYNEFIAYKGTDDSNQMIYKAIVENKD